MYLGIVLLSFFHHELFFYLDEYAGLWRLTQAPSLLSFIAEPHNEHFIPVFHAVWAFEVFFFRENYLLYILTNAMLLSLSGMLWDRWLRQVGGHPVLAVVVPLIAITCLAQADNVMCGWQASALLSAVSLIGVLWAYHRSRFVSLGLLSCCAALTFASAYILPLVLAGFFLYDYLLDRKDWRLLLAAAIFLVGFGVLLKSAMWAGAVSSGGLWPALWAGKDLFQKIANLAWLQWYTLSIAFYGPLRHILQAQPPASPSPIMTVLSLAFVAVLLWLSWTSPSRHLVGKLLVLQVALFMLIAPFRHTPSFVGFSGRYYTAGLIPLLSAIALVMSDFLRQKRVAAGVFVIPLLLLVGINVNRCRVRNDNWFLVQSAGRAARIDYYQTKAWLQRHKDEVLGNHLFSQSVAPWLDLEKLIPIIGMLDPAIVTAPVSLKAVTYVENALNTRGWGPIVEGQPAVQTFRLDQPGVLTKIELLVSRNQQFNGIGRIALLDDRKHTLWELRIPSQLWPADAWLAVPVDLVSIEAHRSYEIQVASSTTNPAETVTVWMNQHPESYPHGDTRTPDGVIGDLCFRLALLEP
jgi:hypothetical protein